MEPFEFKQCITILKSTGRRAKDLPELRDAIATVSDDCIFHHVCEYFLKNGILEYTNDFAQWAGENLKESILAEQLSNIDPFIDKSMADLRDELLKTIDEYLTFFPEPRQTLPGDEFYFNETITIVTSSGIEARNLAEFLIAVRHLDASSIYYHFYESRMRLGGKDDFSIWLEDALGEKTLSEKIRAIDLFMHDIEGTRNLIVETVEEGLKKEMEKLEI